jgi:uncharacterized protein
VSVLAKVGGPLGDAVLGLPLRATAYTVERDVAFTMPDGITLLATTTGRRARPGPCPSS